MPRTEASVERWRTELEPLLADPASAAVLSDLDGTLAPIVARPELVEVPERTRAALERISARFGLCAIVTGRRPEEAREIVGLDSIAYAGNHGFELLEPGEERAVPSSAVAAHVGVVAEFVAEGVDAEELGRDGIRIEDKGPIVALHWRGADDEPAAERAISRIVGEAHSRGLRTHAGRKVLELRPAVSIDKGVAIGDLLDGANVKRAMYAGDDRTDIDGFRALGRLRDAGALEQVLRVGVRSPEGPAELIEAADFAVAGPEELAELLELLAAGAS